MDASAVTRCVWEIPSFYQGWLPPVLSFEKIHKKPKEPWDPPQFAGCLLDTVTEGTSVVFKLHEVDSFSLSRQVSTSGVHCIDTDSNSVPVLHLRTLNKSLWLHQGQSPLSFQGPANIRVGTYSQGVISVRALEFFRLKQIKIFPCEGRTLPRNGGISQGLWGEMVSTQKPQKSTKLSPSMCVFLTLPVAAQFSLRVPQKIMKGMSRLSIVSRDYFTECSW